MAANSSFSKMISDVSLFWGIIQYITFCVSMGILKLSQWDIGIATLFPLRIPCTVRSNDDTEKKIMYLSNSRV